MMSNLAEEIETRRLPYSGGRYLVNQYGELFTGDGEELPVEIVDNEYCVKLCWLYGETVQK